jgi:hypothetical protein
VSGAAPTTADDDPVDVNSKSREAVRPCAGVSSFKPAFVLRRVVLFCVSASGAATTIAEDIPADVNKKRRKSLRPCAGVSSC